MIGRERAAMPVALAAARAGRAAHSGTPWIETSTSKPLPARCWEATARSTSRIPVNGAHGGAPRMQPSAANVPVGGRSGSGCSADQSTASRK